MRAEVSLPPPLILATVFVVASLLEPTSRASAQETAVRAPTNPVLVSRATQHLVVVTEAPGDIQGRLYRKAWVGEPAGWRQVGDAVPVVVGRGGVGPKQEGDGRSPRGVFELGPTFGYSSDPPPNLSLSYRPLAPGTVCVDDPASDHYNRVVDPADFPGEQDWTSAEAMRRDLAHGDDLYEWGAVVRYNEEGRAGAGSCIFLHIWRGPESPTAGCTAMARGDLLSLLGWLHPERQPVLIQGDRAWLEGLRARGVLLYPVPGS